MALPIAISGAFLSFPTGGPVKVGTSFYIVTNVASTVDQVRVYKADSDDPSSGWTEQDTTNRPVATNTYKSMHSVVDGTTIHIATQDDTSSDIEYHTFDTSTDSWSITSESVSTSPSGVPREHVSIAVRSDGDIIVAYASSPQNIMGSDYDRISLARRESGSWTADISVDNLGKTASIVLHPYVVMSANDRAHVFYTLWTGSDQSYSTYLSNNTWGHQNTVADSTAFGSSAQSLANTAVAFDDGGTEKIRCIYFDQTSNTKSVVGFDDSDNPGSSISIATDITGSEPVGGGVAFAVDNSSATQYAITLDLSSNLDISNTGAGDDTWTTSTDEVTGLGTGSDVYSASVYDNGGTVLAYLYIDGSTVYYNEKSLGAGSSNLTATLYSDTDTFHSHTLSATYDLSTTHYSDGDTFGSHTVSQVQSLTSILYTDADSFGNHTIDAVYDLAGSLYSDADVFGSHTIDSTYDLTTTLYSDADTFGSHTISLVTNISSTLFSDADTFGSHSVSASYNLSATLFTDGDTFGSHTLIQDQFTSATLFSDADTFGSHSVSTRYDLSATLFSDGDTFGSNSVDTSNNLAATVFSDGDTFGNHQIDPSYDLSATLFSDGDTFGNHTINIGTTLSTTLFPDGDTFGTHAITTSYDLTTTLFVDDDSFGSHTVSAVLELTATLFSDTDSFGSHSVTTSNDLTATLFANDNSFGSHLVNPSYDLSATLFADGDTFGSHEIILATPQDLTASKYTDIDGFGNHTIAREGDVTTAYVTQYRRRVRDSDGDRTNVFLAGADQKNSKVTMSTSVAGTLQLDNPTKTVRFISPSAFYVKFSADGSAATSDDEYFVGNQEFWRGVAEFRYVSFLQA